MIAFGADGPRVRFRIKADEADVCKPLSEMLEDSLGIARSSRRGRLNTATAFLSNFCGRLFTQSSHSFKIGITTILFIIVGSLVLYFYNQYTRLSKTVETVRVLEVERFVAENIIKTYSGGICLIQGTFIFLDEETGEPPHDDGQGATGY